MDKKIILFAFLLLFSSMVYANALTQVKIRSNVPLNEKLTISGIYTDSDANSGVLCSFFLYDTQTSDKYLIRRLSDEYTFTGGIFSTEYQITEPLFQRGFDYNAVVCCNTACYDQNFYVDQKSEIAFGFTSASLIMDTQFWTNPENSLTVFLIFIFVLFVFSVGFTLWKKL